MSTDQSTLTLEPRVVHGSTKARGLRKNGKVPGIVYGHGRPAASVAIDAKELATFLHGGNRGRLITIVLDGARDTALLRALQRDPVSLKVTHADFQRVGASESISASVPIVTVGVAPGVRDSGGVLDFVTHAIEITGPADKLPDHLEADISKLGIREHVTAADLKLPAGFKLHTPPETTIVSIEASRTASQVEEAATGATLQQPEVASVKPPADEKP